MGSSYGLSGKVFQGYALAIVTALVHFGVLKALKESKSVKPFLTLLRKSDIPSLSITETDHYHCFRKLKEHGWYPGVARARSLVWHRETQTLYANHLILAYLLIQYSYFIGRFNETMEGKPIRLAEPAQRIATFELALPDVPIRWRDWDKDTSRWKW